MFNITDMANGELIAGTVGMLTLAGSLIGVFVTHEKKMALANQANRYTQNQVDKLETRVAELESNIYDKLDHIQESIQEIKISIAKI